MTDKKDPRVQELLNQLFSQAELKALHILHALELQQAEKRQQEFVQEFLDKIQPEADALMRKAGYPVYDLQFVLRTDGSIQILLQADGIDKVMGSC